MIRSGSVPLQRAVAGCFAAAAWSAHGVYLSPDGVGQALVYPYYTVQSANGNAFNTYISIVNTTSRAKAVKVRFLEGRNARKALDFNVFLSPNDVWTASLGPQDGTGQSPALLVTADKSCTSPPIPAGGVAFRNFYYAGANGDGGPTTLDRTREGYLEVIEMANLNGAAATAAVHLSTGVPSNCAYLQPENGFRVGGPNLTLSPPNGGLIGTYTLINVSNGLNFAGNATALGALFAAPNFADVDSLVPNLASADPVASTAAPSSAGAGLVGYRATYANGRDAVSATLMKSSIMNEYALDAGTHSATDWVLTFPTKAFYPAPGGAMPDAPFSATYQAGVACEPFSVDVFDREHTAPTPGTTQFGGVPVVQPVVCFSASVISTSSGATSLARSTVLGSANFPGSVSANPLFPNGWARFTFTGDNARTGLKGAAGGASAVDLAAGRTSNGVLIVHQGLPVIGFAVRTLNNGLLSCSTFGGSTGTCVGSYGMLTDHRYTIKTSTAP